MYSDCSREGKGPNKKHTKQNNETLEDRKPDDDKTLNQTRTQPKP